MWKDRRLLKLFNIDHPILLAPMAGSTDAKLVATVCEAGGLGSLGAAAIKPDALGPIISDIRARTSQKFNVNLFSAHTEVFDRSARPTAPHEGVVAGFHEELGLGPVPETGPMFGPADEQLAVLLEHDVPVISFHFGVDAATVARAKGKGAIVLCSATTVHEARLLEQAGVDAIIAQGAEAGGHRGTFAGDWKEALIGTFVLVPQIVDAVSVPVIAAGGIMDARGLVACLALGAAGVQMGTAFLLTDEAPVAPAWQQQLLSASADQTVVTEVMSGRPARAIRNRYIASVEHVQRRGEPLLPYPAQFSMSRSLRKHAAAEDDADFMAMWAGQGLAQSQRQGAAELVQRLIDDSQALMRSLSSPS